MCEVSGLNCARVPTGVILNLNLWMPSRDYNLKEFLDEAAATLTAYNKTERRDLIEEIVSLITVPDSQANVCEEVLSFCSASVLEMIKTSPESLDNLLRSSRILKQYSNFHVLVDAVTSTFVSLDPVKMDEAALLDAVISGLTAIESQTISLSGSCLIKLLKRDPRGVSRRLIDHPDFVAVLTADMCAMFSRLEEDIVQTVPFIRIVRFCELIIDLSGDPQLEQKILQSVECEFINKIYRSELKQMKLDRTEAVKWCNELMKVCHRGNQLVRPLVSKVFEDLHVSALQETDDLKEILRNERSRPIKEVARLLFTSKRPGCSQILRIPSSPSRVDEPLYRSTLKRFLKSFEQFPVGISPQNCSLSDFAGEMFKTDREILTNWLPFCLQVVEIEAADAEMRMFVDISGRINEFLG